MRRVGKIGRRKVFPEVKNVNVESPKNGSKMLFFSIARRRRQPRKPPRAQRKPRPNPQRHRKRSISQKSTARKKPHEQKFLTLRERCGNATQRFHIPVVSALRSDASEPRSVFSEPHSDTSAPRNEFSAPRNEFSAHNNLSTSNRNRKYPLNLIRHD